LSEALLFEEHGENMLCTKIVLNVGNNFCTQHVLPRFEHGIFMYWTCNSMNNLWSYCGLVDEKIRASDKDLPVLSIFFYMNIYSTFSRHLLLAFYTLLNWKCLLKVYVCVYLVRVYTTNVKIFGLKTAKKRSLKCMCHCCM
jgi:hypothetical protein